MGFGLTFVFENGIVTFLSMSGHKAFYIFEICMKISIFNTQQGSLFFKHFCHKNRFLQKKTQRKENAFSY